jgi:hypothetical protein
MQMDGSSRALGAVAKPVEDKIVCVPTILTYSIVLVSDWVNC